MMRSVGIPTFPLAALRGFGERRPILVGRRCVGILADEQSRTPSALVEHQSSISSIEPKSRSLLHPHRPFSSNELANRFLERNTTKEGIPGSTADGSVRPVFPSSSLFDRLMSPSLRLALLTSSSTDPFLNLSIEQYLLERCAPESRVLFQYINRPCVVIGRNQNPWVETNLRRTKEGFSIEAAKTANCGRLRQDASSTFGAGRHRTVSSAEALEREKEFRMAESREGSGTELNRTRSNEDLPEKLAKNTDQGGSVIESVDLVRRRSGGGTVFHDGGNVNWSVIVPAAEFDRDTHAQMVTDALHGLGITNARVNERHDIVLDFPGPGEKKREIGGKGRSDSDGGKPAWVTSTFKVSGSAYRLTRRRALHHATCLIESPNLSMLSSFLRPACKALSSSGELATMNGGVGYSENTKLKAKKIGFDAKGVASVRSPVTNIGDSNRRRHDEVKMDQRNFVSSNKFDAVAGIKAGSSSSNIGVGSFIRAVQQQFSSLYQSALPGVNRDDGSINESDDLQSPELVAGTVGKEMLSVPEIAKGYAELKSAEWKFLQTPHFTLTLPLKETKIESSKGDSSCFLPFLELEARHGVITRFDVVMDSSLPPPNSTSPAKAFSHPQNCPLIIRHPAILQTLQAAMVGKQIHAVADWAQEIFGNTALTSLIDGFNPAEAGATCQIGSEGSMSKPLLVSELLDLATLLDAVFPPVHGPDVTDCGEE